MLHELSRLLGQNDSLDAEEMRRSAAILLERQFLFSDKGRDLRYYHTIIDFEEYFSNLFDALNFDLKCARVEGYVGVIPKGSDMVSRLAKDQSLFLLVLRIIYEQQFQECRIGENLQAFTDSEILVNSYVSHTGAKRPLLGRLRDILKAFSRQGLLDIDDDDDKLIRFRIRPSIRDVVTDGYLKALEAYIGLADEADDLTCAEEDLSEETQ